MNSNRLTYQSCLIFASDSEYKRASQAIYQIPRTQSSSLGIDYSLTEDTQIGYAQTQNNFGDSRISFDFNSLLTDYNCFEKFGLSQNISGKNYFFENFSGINTQRNFYIFSVDNGEDVRNKWFFDNCYATAITECVFEEMSLDISLNNPVKTSFSLNGLNVALKNGNPNSYELSNGESVSCNFQMGKDFTGVTAFSPNNIVLNLSENEYSNLNIKSCHISDIKVSFSLDRTDTREIREKAANERNILYPVKCKLDISAIPKDKSEFSVLDLFDLFKKNSFSLDFYDKNNVLNLSLFFDNMYLTSSKNSLEIGSPESSDISFYGNLGPNSFSSDISRFYTISHTTPDDPIIMKY